MREYSIAAIPGDGIGPEVIAAGLERAGGAAPSATATSRFNVDHFDWGSDYYKKHGVMMPADGLATAQEVRRDLFRRGRRARRARPHHAVGPAPADLPGLRPVRQCAPDAHPAGHHQAAARRRRRATSTG